ncbi:XTP/dITP diphosphatase [Bacillaceae bacterium Marseille-Q3522]|nr:XTP/dITP diphosphatase [Bacillaceae bacterium Marseille-Q3522]
MQKVIIATKNAGKAKEFTRMLEPLDCKVQTLLDYPEIADIEETGSTFEENAIIKADTVSRLLGTVVIADDSGLIIDALDGRPGIYSARYAGEKKNDQANIEKVLKELSGVEQAKRTARFYCALAVAIPGKETITVHGSCEGSILQEKRGENGFGYDPIFFVTAKRQAMAELSPAEKSQISHRAHALDNLESLLPSLFIGGNLQ